MPTESYPVGIHRFWVDTFGYAGMTDANEILMRITKRPDYLAVAAARRKWVTPSFILQALPRESDSPPRIGFTVSKKVGKAVTRNRARRRLKEAARDVLTQKGKPGWSYVLVGRAAAKEYDFLKMQADLKWSLAKLHAGADLKAGKTQKPKIKKGQA